MKLTKIESYEIQAFAFRVMTGYVAPGKDASPLADEAPYEKRCAAFDEWRNEHAPCILAMLHGFEALIDRDDEPTRALLDRLDKADEMRDVLLRNGFVECDISACNCGSWHHRYGLPEWMREIERVLADAGHERSNDNGHSILRALNALIDRLDKGLNALIARLDKAERECERLREDAERYRWLRGREDGRYMTVYAFRTDIDEVCLGDELDAAIDAAMKDQK